MSIEIKVELSADRLKVSMVDGGIPFNPLGVETPDMQLPLEEREIGGLGIHLVRNMMDKVSYRRRIDKNVITIVEYLNKENIAKKRAGEGRGMMDETDRRTVRDSKPT